MGKRDVALMSYCPDDQHAFVDTTLQHAFVDATL
jgi:hypothetical protein